MEESEPGPKFRESERASLMRRIDPVTLHFRQTDEITKKAVQLFARQVVLILHTCNDNEYWAALERLEPPTTKDGSNIRDRPIIYPQVGSVIGWFSDYRAAVVRTKQGGKCRDELMKALTKLFPNGQVIIGTGIAYANSQKRKFADVLVSDQIENFVQYKKAGDEMINQGPREEIAQNVQRVFENPASDWTNMKHFPCTEDNRASVAHIGCVVSAPTLVKDEKLRDKLMECTPYAIGGEMEGWVLLELKKTLKDHHNKDIEVIVMKGVADYGDLKKGDEWQWTAAKAAINCIHYCLEKSGGIEFNAIEIARRVAHEKDGAPSGADKQSPHGESMFHGKVAKSITCSACGKEGHTKRSKSCSAHKENCYCGIPVVELTVKKKNKNKGRVFYNCSKQQCHYFQWKGDRPPLPPRCGCRLPSVLKTVKKTSNRGKKFWACSKPIDQQCKFFEWVERSDIRKSRKRKMNHSQTSTRTTKRRKLNK